MVVLASATRTEIGESGVTRRRALSRVANRLPRKRRKSGMTHAAQLRQRRTGLRQDVQAEIGRQQLIRQRFRSISASRFRNR